MDIIKLRNKILLEAMHGNIVKNDDSFSPVSIEASEEVGTFDIPSNWKWITIKDICNRLYAGGDKTKHFSKIETDAYNVPVVANGKDNDGIIGYTNIATENEKCLTISGRGTIGYSVIRNYPFSPVVRLLVLKPKDEIDLQFLKYACDCFVNHGEGTSIPQLTIPMIKDILLPIPPFNQQKLIVSQLNFLFSKLIDLEKHSLTLKEKVEIVKRKLYKLAINNFNNSTDDWDEDQLGNILLYEQPTKYIVSSEKYDNNYEIPVLTAGKTFVLGYTNEKDGIFTDIPVIIFDDFTTATKYVDFPFKVKSSAMKILKCNSDYNIKFYYYLLQSIDFDSSTHKRYWISEFAPMRVPVPPKEEQDKIVEKVEQLLSLIDQI